MTSFFELRTRSDAGIFAVPYRAGRRLKTVRLPDGAIVEATFPDQWDALPSTVDETFGVGHGGAAATVHDENLGLIRIYLAFSGVYLLPSGDPAAIYGAEVNPIGVDSVTD